MEYLPLGDLHDYLSESPCLPEVEAQLVTFQLLEGLSFMHRNGFMHRDLKPKNILIKAKPPQPWWVKIGDFGISRRADEEFSATTALHGTLGFIAPELYGLVNSGKEHRHHILGASDMWALGETAFRMLTNKPAFPELKHLDRYAQGRSDFPAKSLTDLGVTQRAVSFLETLLTVDPEKRATADSALEHDWMLTTKASKETSRPPSLLFAGLEM